ncbi:MAG TPA: MoxR family ATPase [Acidimicrobiales bacterium]|nr:MoxR family ATPase [Acidimicrobiales bacterium]
MDPAGPATHDAQRLETALFEIKKVIVGQDRAIERLVVCLLARGHCLLEGVPGLAKTLMCETVARVTGGTFARLQFTPDLLPADLVGTRVYRASTETFDVELGPVFANLVLADEINRAPAKVQSALLEVMAEHHVSIGGQTHPVPEPFLVLATQNPIESEGVYPLPEAQRDRFLMKVLLGYPSRAEEAEVVLRMGVHPPRAEQVFAPQDVLELQAAADRIYADRGVVDYAVNLVFATRDPGSFGLGELAELLQYGASPRASLGLIAAGRALALLRGRGYLLPQDVFDVAPDVLRHRLVLSYEALARELTPDHLLARILGTVPAPRIAPSMSPSAAHAPQAAPVPARPQPVPDPTPAPAAAAAYGPPAVAPVPPPGAPSDGGEPSSNGDQERSPAPPA